IACIPATHFPPRCAARFRAAPKPAELTADWAENLPPPIGAHPNAIVECGYAGEFAAPQNLILALHQSDQLSLAPLRCSEVTQLPPTPQHRLEAHPLAAN